MRRTADTASRSIPAYAGEPYDFGTLRAIITVHPRLRGGAIALKALAGVAAGPSPPTRGSRRCRCDKGRRERSIPAYAGEPYLEPGELA